MNPVPMAFVALAVGVGASVLSAQQPQSPRQLSEPLPLAPTEDVDEFVFSPDGSQLAYRVGNRLYLRAADGTGAPVLLATNNGLVDRPTPPRFLGDGVHLLYAVTASGGWRVFTVPLDGSSPPFEPIGQPVHSYALTPDETRIVYTDDPFANGHVVLLSRPLAGGIALVLNGVLQPPGGDVGTEFVISPDGRSVVYRAEEVSGIGMHAAAVDVARSSVFISPFTVIATSMAVTADSRRVVFVFGTDDLYSTPIDGSAPPLLLSNAVAPQEPRILITPDSTRAIVLTQLSSGSHIQFRLYSTRLDGASPAQDLNPAGSVRDVRMTGDGSRVLFRADVDPNVPGKLELFSAPADGATPAMRLSLDMPATGDVTGFALSPDGERVVWRADATRDGHFDLYGAPTDGSAPATLLAAPARADEDVDERLVFGSGGTQVAFLTGAFEGELALFRVRTDGSAAPVRLDDHLVLPDDGPDPLATPDGARLVYRRVLAESQEVRSVAFTGLAPPVRLVAARHLGQQGLSPDGASLAFLADAEIDTVQELYVRPLDGSTPAIQISQEFAPSELLGNVHGFRVAGERVLYLSTQDVSGTTGLFSVPLRGPGRLRISGDVDVIEEGGFELAGGRAVFRGWFGEREHLLCAPVDRLADPIVLDAGAQPGFTVQSYTITPGGQRALFLADLDERGVFQLYRAPVTFQGFPHPVNGPLVSGGDVLPGFRITPDERRVLYVADQDVDNRFELYSGNGSGATRRLTAVGVTDVQTDLELSPDGSRVFFRVKHPNGSSKLFSAPCDGSAAPVELSVSPLGITSVLPGFRITADGAYVLFAGLPSTGHYGLFRADSAGGTPALPLSASLPNFDVTHILVTPGDTHAVFFGLGRIVGIHDEHCLFAVPMGGGTPVRLSVASPGFVVGGEPDAPDFQITPDGTRVLYRFHSAESRHTSLAIVPIDRSSPTLRLDPGTRDVDTFRLDPSATSVLYRTQSEDVQDPGVLNRVPIDGSLPAVQLTSLADDVGPDFDIASDGTILYRAEPFRRRFPPIEHRSLFALLTEAPPFEAPAPTPSVTATRTH